MALKPWCLSLCFPQSTGAALSSILHSQMLPLLLHPLWNQDSDSAPFLPLYRTGKSH